MLEDKSGGSICNIVFEENQKTNSEDRVQNDLKDQKRIEESKFWGAK